MRFESKAMHKILMNQNVGQMTHRCFMMIKAIPSQEQTLNLCISNDEDKSMISNIYITISSITKQVKVIQKLRFSEPSIQIQIIRMNHIKKLF